MQEPQSIKDKAQDFCNKIQEIEEKLELPEKQKIIAIEAKDDINLGGELNRKSVFVIKIQDENGEFYHIVTDKETNQIATILKDGKVELSDREKQLWEKFVGKEGNQTPEQKKIYDFEEEYFLEEYKTEEIKKQDKKEEKNKKQDKKEDSKEQEDEKKAAESLKVEDTAIISMIKIEDRETFGQAINTKLYADAYIVRYGNNKTKIMQSTSDGKLREISGLKTNEFNSEVIEQLNMKKTGNNQKIKPGDLTTIKTEDDKYNYIVVREKDANKGIVIVNSTDTTKVYTFDDEGKENLREIETSIQYEVEKKKEEKEHELKIHKKEIEQEDEQEEGRTPWGDAYSRMRR